MTEFPEYKTVSVSMKRNGTKEATCGDCGIILTVRKDTNPKVCQRCASARGGKAMKGKTRSPMVECKLCKKLMRESLGYTYCSLECRKTDKQELKTCKTCDASFSVYKSAMKESTNSSGIFCSRPCYEKWMCNTERTTGRGSQWSKIRKEAIRLQPFCALCGTRNGLQVHHIAPFRLSNDNSQKNLVPLCAKHHKIVESITHDVEYAGSSPEDMTLIMGSMLKECQMATRMKLMGIIRATA